MSRHVTALLLTLTAGCMSSTSSATTPPNDMPTAGSSGDTGTNSNIFGLHDSGTAWEDADGGLMMVPQDASADATEPELLDAGLDADVLPAPDAGHDAAMPPGQTCDPCASDADCAAGYTCKDRPIDEALECFQRLDAGPCPGGTEPKVTACLPANFEPCLAWLGH